MSHSIFPDDVWRIVIRCMLPCPQALCVSSAMAALVWEELKEDANSLPVHTVHFPPLRIDVSLLVRDRPQYVAFVAISMRRRVAYRTLKTFKVPMAKFRQPLLCLDKHTTLRWRPGGVFVVEYFEPPTLFVVSEPLPDRMLQVTFPRGGATM